MENTYTIAKILFSKEVQGKFGPQQNVRFTTNETGEKSISGFFKYELKPGQQITGEIVEKPGTDRDGNPVTYHNFNMAKKPQGGGIDEGTKAQLVRIERAVNAILNELKIQKGGVSSLEGVVEYPENKNSVPFEEDPFASDPDFDPFGGMNAR